MTPPIHWTSVTDAPVLSNGQWLLTLPLDSNISRFYGLRP
jgi:hypothetical protein